ncbi:hypothetical protein ANCDUO_12296 [Ancylostoma duodenale]|uniref:Uncharacterized protein n=1 Tax=Ancylostoma duodenale TaxID=51022 RepID=A0A0C2G968_9BILA|nr:hypothetical protein ANCDUO_12296 [Ancylostoma duodenale]
MIRRCCPREGLLTEKHSEDWVEFHHEK